MPRTFERDTSPRLSLPMQRRVRQHFGKEQRRLDEGECLMRHRNYSLREHGTLARSRDEVLAIEQCFHLLYRHHAMVLPMPPATSWQTRLRITPKRKQRRDQRKAEHQ